MLQSMVYQREPLGTLPGIRRFRNGIKKVDQELCQGTTLCPLFLLKAEINQSWWGRVKTLNWAETNAPNKQQPPFPLSTVNYAFTHSGPSHTEVNVNPRSYGAYLEENDRYQVGASVTK